MKGVALSLLALVVRLTAAEANDPQRPQTKPRVADTIEAQSRIKTDALVNLPHYVEWPPGAFVVPRTPLIIGVYGHSKIYRQAFEAAHGKMLNGRQMLVRRFYWPQVPNCHMLFIAPSERNRLPWIMKKIEYSTTLTVAEFDDFLTRGGMVRMFLKDDKVRFDVNMLVATQAGIKFSSQFLGLVEKVIGGP